MVKKKGINNALVLKDKGTEVDKLTTERDTSMDISPSLERAMFSSFLAGESFKRIAETYTNNGYPISAHRVSKIAKFYSWENQRLELDVNIARQLGDETEQVRTRLLQTQNLMIGAISDEINREYQEYVVDMADYERGVLREKPEKPDWLTPKYMTLLQDSWFRVQNKGAERVDVDAHTTMINLGVNQDQVSEMLRVMAQGKRPKVADTFEKPKSLPENTIEVECEKEEEKKNDTMVFEIGKKNT